MKKLLFSLLFVLCFAIQVQAVPSAKRGVNVMPKPIPQTAGKACLRKLGVFYLPWSPGTGRWTYGGRFGPQAQKLFGFKCHEPDLRYVHVSCH